ncbi:hypothetical protein C8R42DRAFT_718709 [Lentinula raphanica]|nr:hypothetical protein C8R42DRAFT_718709 [Lentinula raphanica]
MGIFQESHEEQVLQAHIRQLLYDYAKEHLTTSYVEFTEQAVAELLPEALHVILTTDNSSVRLPGEPFTALSRLYVLRELKRPYDEEAIECVESDEISEDLPRWGVELQKRIDGSNFTTLSPEEQNEVLSLRHWSHRTSEHLDSAEWGVVIEERREQFDEANIHFHRSPKGTAIRKQYEDEKNRLRTALWLVRDKNEELEHEEREEEECEEREVEAAHQSELEASHTKAAASANQFSPMQSN